LTLAGIATGPPNAELNPTAFPTFLEWDKVQAAVDPSVDRPRPKAPELVSVNDLPWYPIQPSSVKKRLDHWEHRDVEKLAERPFRSLSEPRPRSNGGEDAFDVHHTLWLLYALLTGEGPTAEEETMLHLHGLPAKYITFAVNQLTTTRTAGRSTTASVCQRGTSCGCYATCIGWHTPPRPSYFLPTPQIGFALLWSITVAMQCTGPWGTATSFLRALFQRWYELGWIGFPLDMLILKWSYLLLVI